ncbi:MurR/RpiR family transcriptional regulator [Saccharibacillus sp. CPCC 101409]|uniref:MurR/RpiR family transcriptional regulator n=1 Tax=Saccharibacillus sp. CPCC 101409 TaxID=3058041 RepID=UPI0026718142|nr:MurR/RpiR family transcriptional regulator [Saccharibacillus sp. CPCC 101409]MDO3412393.1 MurR/RpiR family transcriptional regulator [Saccharibacillus sp. CPCC 101409]
MNLLVRLTQMKHFTPNEKSIAAYILKQKENMLHLTAKELAAVTFTSHSAVHRLTQKLGLSGYKEFSVGLAKEFQKHAQSAAGVDPNYPFGTNDSPLQIAADIAVLMQETLRKNLAFVDETSLSRAVELLHSAKRIFLYAVGDSQIRAKSFQNKMLKIDKYVILAAELSEWSYNTANLTPNDCAIFLTYHGSSSNFAKVARFLNEEQVPLIAISAAGEHEISELSTVFIQIPHDEEKLAKIGTFSSQLAFEYMLNVIYSCLYNLDYERLASLHAKHSFLHHTLKNV